MRDINGPLQKAYFTALNGNVLTQSGDPVKIYEDEQPTHEDGEVFIVIMGRDASDVSTKNSFDHNAQVQVVINTRKNFYNNRRELNFVADQCLQILHPSPKSTLQTDGAVRIITTTVDQNEIDYGILAQQAFVSRNLIFSHLVSYN